MQLTAFDRNSLDIRPLSERIHDLNLSVVSRLEPRRGAVCDEQLKIVAGRIIAAREKGASVILMMGGHVIRSGVQNYLIDLISRGYISCIATNGAGMIHDFEFALVGATTENVAKYIKQGQFGLWEETSRINEYINQGYRDNQGMGQAVGKAICEGDFPFKDISVLAAAYRCEVPVTVHVGIGCDIIHEHPNCSGAATGETSYRDFLRFTGVVENLEGGVVMNFGSAVMAPEVFLKALSMARNKARKAGRSITHFTSLVCDLRDLGRNFRAEASKDDQAYYFRPWKTMLVRTVADGGESFYVREKHSQTIPGLWNSINGLETRSGSSHRRRQSGQEPAADEKGG
ncbi:MAG TPA: hypothetical protein VJJ98_04830 [Sedimentisphaerales bacterium]|nr:hypothetical protein [Sedimentisphaerales bacterium]